MTGTTPAGTPDPTSRPVRRGVKKEGLLGEEADESDTKSARVREAFLIAYRATASVAEACRQAHISRETAYQWRQSDPAFAQAWEEAHEIAVDDLEARAWQRAMDSSDQLMTLLLRAHRPERYRETYRVEHSNTDDEALVERTKELAARVRELLPGVGAPLALPAAGSQPDAESREIPG